MKLPGAKETWYVQLLPEPSHFTRAFDAWMGSISGFRIYYIALLLVLVICLIPIWIVDYPGMTDYPNHLVRDYILAHYDESPLWQQRYSLDLTLLPNSKRRSPGSAGVAVDFENSGSIPPAFAFVLPKSMVLHAAAVVAAFAFHRLRSGPFEGPATVKPPALPEDTYFKKEIPRLCRGGSRTLRIPGVYLPLLLSFCRSPWSCTLVLL